MFYWEWPENLSIFLENLCLYHVCLDLFSLFMVAFTWWYCKSININSENETQAIHLKKNNTIMRNFQDLQQIKFIKAEGIKYKNDTLHQFDSDILSCFKFMKQKALVSELKSKLTEDELEEERKAEKMQLERIFQLLQLEKDKFQMNSIDQLEEQLHLYIH